jgi:hypothetical protein
MFEPFVRGDSEQTGGASGAGLGLSISRRLAEMMSGTITVESAPGRGTTFTLWLRSGSPPTPSGRTGARPASVAALPTMRPRGRPADDSELAPPRV